MGLVKEIYSKCKDDFLLGLLVNPSTPLLYSNNAKSPAEMFLGQKIATNIPYILFGTAALMQCPRNSDHDHECRFEPNEGDVCYARLNPVENVSEKGFVVRKVIGVPDSYVVEVDGHRYHHNKHDLTLSPPDDSNDKSDSHPDDHDVAMATGVMPALRPRPQLKFPKLPAQATQQKDFNL